MSIIDYSWDFTKEEFSLDLDFFNEKEQEDKLWQARTGLDYETLCGAIETIIFMNDRPVNLIKIKNQIDPDLPLRVVHESIARLQSEYEAKHHGIRLMEVAQGYQFRTKATYSKIVQNMFKVQSLQLSPTALEVLAIIAYKQPVSKNDVESVRGVDSSHIIRALMDRRLVRIVGRSEEVGRPSLYGTSHEFLEVFNLNDINELPSETELDELATANEIGEISDIKNIVNTGDKKKFDLDELEELDELSSSIKDIASDTLFTRSLKDMDKKRKTDDGVEKKSAFDILEEYVNKAQIIDQNKDSVESEIVTTMMEPKTVALNMLNQLLNVPEIDEDFEEDDLIEFESEMDLSELPKSESGEEFVELNSDGVKEIEAQADVILEKSENLINQLLENSDQMVEAQTQDLASELESELDLAFENLMEDVKLEEEQVQDEVEPMTTSQNDSSSFYESAAGDLDIASFIAGKIEAAQVEEKEDKALFEEKQELEDALDEAFDKLTFESKNDEDMDFEIPQISLDSENNILSDEEGL